MTRLHPEYQVSGHGGEPLVFLDHGKAVAVAVALGGRVSRRMVEPWQPLPGQGQMTAAGALAEVVRLLVDEDNVTRAHQLAHAFGLPFDLIVRSIRSERGAAGASWLAARGWA